MKAAIVEILLNTLEPNTAIVKDSQLKLEKCETDPEFPVILAEIICEANNHPKKLDLIAVVELSKCIRMRYKSQEPQAQLRICEAIMKLLEIVDNTKIMNEVILIFRQIAIIEYPNSVCFKIILDNFTEKRLSELEKLSPYRKFVILKLVYKCIKGIHKEKTQGEELWQHFKAMLDGQVSGCLVNLMRQLLNDLSSLGSQLEAIQNGPSSNLEAGLSETFAKINQSFFFDSTKYIFKIYSLYNITSRYSPLGDFNVVVLARHFHQIYKLISNMIISSGLINKMQSTKDFENIAMLINVTEKHLMLSVEKRIVKIEDLEVIFEHFISMYFSNSDHLVFYGEKFVDYQQLSNPQYLKMVCETEVYSKMKFHEEKLLLTCINTLSNVLENFTDSSEEPNLVSFNQQKEGIATVQKFFAPKLEMIIKKLLEQILLIDVNDLYKLKTDSEEYYVNLDLMGDEDTHLRILYMNKEAAKKLLTNIAELVDEGIIIKLCQAIQNELVTFPPENIREFKQMLKRESNYYLLTKLHDIVKNDIEFDSLIIHCLASDLKIQDKNFEIVKVQLLQLVEYHVLKAYTIEENLSKEIFSTIYTLISQQMPENICLVLLAVKILLRLVETNSQFASLIPEVALPIFNLCKQVSYMKSRLIIFEFFEYSIIGNFPDYYAVIWEICEATYNSCKDTSLDTMNLKSKVINILIKLIETTEIEYQKVPFMVGILEDGIQDDESFEEFIMEGSFHLFGKLLTKLDLTVLNNETIQKITNLVRIVCSLMIKRFDLIPISVIILENCIISRIAPILAVIGKGLIEGLDIWVTDLKETTLRYYFDMAELYIISSKDNRAEFSVYLLEKLLSYVRQGNGSNELYMSNILKFLARLAFEDVEVLYGVLSNISAKLGVNDCKYNLLSNFYDLIKDETVTSTYYLKKSFCFYTFAVLAVYLKELEANEGIDFNQISLTHNNVFQGNFKAIIQAFCKCLSELYGYDSNQLEYIESEIYLNLQVLLEQDTYLIANEFALDAYRHLTKFLMDDPMRRFDIYSQVKNMLGNSQVILNDTEAKAIIEKEINF